MKKNNEENDIRVFKLSESPLFRSGDNSKINVNSSSYNDDEYNAALSDAEKQGFAFIINGEEPTNDELVKIKEIYDRAGVVKIFRKRRKDVSDRCKFSKSFSIKPSGFKRIGGTELNREEISSFKESVCHRITDLIRG